MSGSRRVSGLPEDHARWGTWVVLSAGLLFLSVAALWWLDRRNDVRTTRMKALAVLQVVLAAVAFTFVCWPATPARRPCGARSSSTRPRAPSRRLSPVVPGSERAAKLHDRGARRFAVRRVRIVLDHAHDLPAPPR